MENLNFLSSVYAMTLQPEYKPIIPAPAPGGGGGGGGGGGAVAVTNIKQEFTTTKVDPEDVHLATLNAIKYGQAITLPKNAPVTARTRDM
jgi:hypothetical protein